MSILVVIGFNQAMVKEVLKRVFWPFLTYWRPKRPFSNRKMLIKVSLQSLKSYFPIVLRALHKKWSFSLRKQRIWSHLLKKSLTELLHFLCSGIFDHDYLGQTSLRVRSVIIGLILMKIEELKILPWESKKLDLLVFLLFK